MARIDNVDELWDIEDEEFKDVLVPEWKRNGEPVTIRIRCLSGLERDRYEDSLVKTVKGRQVMDPTNARARLVAWSAVKGDGTKLFPGGVETVLKLGMKNAKALNRIWEAACELSGIDFDGSQVEEDEKNFDSGPSESSTSD